VILIRHNVCGYEKLRSNLGWGSARA